jgi:hypothetical protein
MLPARRALPPAAAFAIAVLAAASIGIAVSAQAEETAADIPANSYYKDPLTATERSGIASEENVSPNDGSPSVPPAADDGVIPDAAVDAKDPSGAQPQNETAEKPTAGESEAEVVIQDSKKNYRVSRQQLTECENQWGPETQMTRQEWAASCRTTLEYFPEPK